LASREYPLGAIGGHRAFAVNKAANTPEAPALQARASVCGGTVKRSQSRPIWISPWFELLGLCPCRQELCLYLCNQ